MPLLGKMECLNLQVVAVLMPLEIKHHTIPYLKALKHTIEHSSGQRRGSTFICQNSYLKSTYFTFYRGKRIKASAQSCMCIYSLKNVHKNYSLTIPPKNLAKKKLVTRQGYLSK